MSLWLNKLRPASFRGVPFFLLEDAGIDVGRRRANHEYAGRDKPYSEDMGRKQRSYTINGGVDGDGFIEKANKLIDAFERQGPGILVHPFLGEINVTVEAKFTFQGRFASFQMTANEAGDNTNPSRSADTRSIIGDRAITAQAASINVFSKQYDVAGPEFVRENALENITNVLSQIQGGQVPGINDLSKIIGLPGELSGFLFDALDGVNDSSSESISSLLNGFSQDQNTLSAVTPSRQKSLNNERAINRLVREAVVIDAAKNVIDFNFVARADAVAGVSDITANLEDVSFDADDQSYRALTDLRIAVQQDMQERLPSLPTVQKINVVQPLPSLVAAYRYGDGLQSEQAIIARNNIAHPGFIRGELEVINGSANV